MESELTLKGYKSGKYYCVKNLQNNEIIGSENIKISIDYIEKHFLNTDTMQRNKNALFIWENENGEPEFSSEDWNSIFNFLAPKKLLDTIKSAENKIIFLKFSFLLDF